MSALAVIMADADLWFCLPFAIGSISLDLLMQNVGDDVTLSDPASKWLGAFFFYLFFGPFYASVMGMVGVLPMLVIGELLADIFRPGTIGFVVIAGMQFVPHGVIWLRNRPRHATH